MDNQLTVLDLRAKIRELDTALIEANQTIADLAEALSMCRAELFLFIRHAGLLTRVDRALDKVKP